MDCSPPLLYHSCPCLTQDSPTPQPAPLHSCPSNLGPALLPLLACRIRYPQLTYMFLLGIVRCICGGNECKGQLRGQSRKHNGRSPCTPDQALATCPWQGKGHKHHQAAFTNMWARIGQYSCASLRQPQVSNSHVMPHSGLHWLHHALSAPGG